MSKPLKMSKNKKEKQNKKPFYTILGDNNKSFGSKKLGGAFIKRRAFIRGKTE